MADSALNSKLNILRAGVLGANDGIVSVAGVVVGVAAAGVSTHLVAISGIAAILAGAFSMAGGEYVSVSTQLDTEKAYAEENKVEEMIYTNPWEAAISSFFSFVIGSVLPLFFVLVFPQPLKIIGTVIGVSIGLVLTGYISARLGKARVIPAIRRNLFVGLLTMAVTYAIGLLVT